MQLFLASGGADCPVSSVKGSQGVDHVHAHPQAVNGKLNALRSIRFYPCRSVADFELPLDSHPASFQPLYAHSFFENETIHGWAECHVSIFYSQDFLDVFVKVDGSLFSTDHTCEQEVDSQSGVQLAIDTAKHNLIQKLLSVPFPNGFCETEEEFRSKLATEERLKFECAGTPHLTLRLPNPIEAQSDIEVEVRRLVFNPDDANSQLIHRRIEWFLHFLIDACSSIEYDPRWTVLLAYIKRPLNCSSEQNVSAMHPKRKRGVGGDRQLTGTAATSGSLPKRIKTGEGTFQEATAKGSSQLACDADTKYVYELAGFLSLYKFFALPKCRRRISQFVVLPPFQGIGLGLCLLEIAHLSSLREEDVMELTVEDPAHAFRQLRDVTSLKIAVERNIISKQQLYPAEHDDTNENPLATVVESLRREVKESPTQASRIAEILALAGLMPHPMPPSPPVLFRRNESVSHFAEESESLEARLAEEQAESPIGIGAVVGRDWRPLDPKPHAAAQGKVDTDSVQFSSSDPIKPYRVRVKKRIRSDYIEVFSSLKPGRARRELEILWQNEYASYYRTIRKMRDMFPLND